MKTPIILVLAVVSCAFGKEYNDFPNNWFTQTMDHFNPQDLRTWNQRYLMNQAYTQNPATDPIFVQIGGEGPIDDRDVSLFQIGNYAQKYNANIFALEHRFYGQSQPFSDLSTQNLAYLTSEQALADTADFILGMRQQYNLSGPVVTFGCSYSGALAAWFRMKYPTVTLGSVASSAPILAVLDFYEYDEVVDASLSIFGTQCVSRISEAVSAVQSMLQTPSGISKLETLFNTCAPLMTSLDIQNFASLLMGNFQGVVQYNDDNRNPISRTWDVTAVCNIMVNSSYDALTAYAAVNAALLNAYQSPCLDASYNDMMVSLFNISWPNDGRSWTYQTCAEFGYFQTTDSPRQPFGNLSPLSFYTGQCQSLFGNTPGNVQKNVDATNRKYGGKNLNPWTSTNIVFVNGNVDPWHALGITKSVSSDLPAVFIEGGAHCSNVYPDSAADSAALIAARSQISETINAWLIQFDVNKK
eukprot:TRINITY_DN976_c0_g1_i1.p1 TRINITY_DN976_c0_g1~~TRINITY_DN976_c0_g1_i1.p1  ORF type:complete len:478 (-),score=104.81 TRINITY_DN976_c0_g1_i1:87-1496(-)